MCRSQHDGGRRCGLSKTQRNVMNQRRREKYWKDKVESQVKELGEEWGGEVDITLDSPTLVKAYHIAVVAHSGVRRKTGDTYINHPLRVASYLQQRGFNDSVVASALLHDAVEDSDLTLESLSQRHGFSQTIVEAVDAVTKRDGEDYNDAMHRAANNPIGRLVKLSDNLDNSTPGQLEFLTPKKRLKAQIKYTEGRQILWQALYGKNEEHRKQVREQIISVHKDKLTFTQW